MNTMAPEAIITAEIIDVRPILDRLEGYAHRLFREAYNDEAFVSGVCERFYVRAGLDSTWSDLDAAVTLVQAILAGYADDDLRWMTRANRTRVAVAAMRGWAEHHKLDHPPLVWVRHMNGQRLWVTEVAA